MPGNTNNFQWPDKQNVFISRIHSMIPKITFSLAIIMFDALYLGCSVQEILQNLANF
jgi:hypothetical protein